MEKERRPNGFFTRMNDEELLEYCFSVYGECVTKGKLKTKDHSLYNIITSRGLINKIKIQRKPKGYYEKWVDAERALKKVIKENNGEFPTRDILKKLGHGDLYYSIIRYHGKLNGAREKMGYEPIVKPSLKDWENVKFELKKFIEKLRHFPTHKELSSFNKGGLSMAIRKYHGGINLVRKKMGFGFKRVPNGYYENWEVYRRDMNKVIQENNGEFPTASILRRLRYDGLVRFAKKYGGFPAVREKMGYNEQTRIKLAKELEEIVDRMVA